MFAIVSWGCAATRWIASVLDRNPDIFCTHAANHTWHVLGGCERLDGVRYLRVLGSQACGHIAAGDIHGVSREHIPELREVFGRQFNSAVVVREPLARIRSHMGLLEHFDGREYWDLGYLDPILASRGIKLPSSSYRDRFFVHSANMLNAITEEIRVGKIFRAEDLTDSANALGGFIDEVTRGKVRPAGAWLRDALHTPAVNMHAAEFRLRLEDWHIDVIRRIVSPQSWDLYQSLGYRGFDVALSTASGARNLEFARA